MVPEIEEREAAIFAGLTWREWGEQSRRERIHSLAHFRLHRLIETHTDDAVTRFVEAKERRKKQSG